jgi:hypothetical protein
VEVSGWLSGTPVAVRNSITSCCALREFGCAVAGRRPARCACVLGAWMSNGGTIPDTIARTLSPTRAKQRLSRAAVCSAFAAASGGGDKRASILCWLCAAVKEGARVRVVLLRLLGCCGVLSGFIYLTAQGINIPEHTNKVSTVVYERNDGKWSNTLRRRLQDGLAVVNLDMKNAFNTVSRRRILEEAFPLLSPIVQFLEPHRRSSTETEVRIRLRTFVYVRSLCVTPPSC